MSKIKYWEKFKTFKERGEWVELQFMAAAAQRRFAVNKPWGDTQSYDVGIEHGQNFLRVQIKSTTRRSGAGYRCQFMPNHTKKHDYSLKEIDLFAAYVIPEDIWYLIPAAVLLGKHRLTMAMLCPVVTPVKKASYRYECFRDNWNMLTRSRAELLQCAMDRSSVLHERSSESLAKGHNCCPLFPRVLCPRSLEFAARAQALRSPEMPTTP